MKTIPVKSFQVKSNQPKTTATLLHDPKLTCKNHRPQFEKEEGGLVYYHCKICFWRGTFKISGINNTPKA